MPKTKVKDEYEELKELNDILPKVIEKYPEDFYGLDLDEVKCVAITNNQRSENQEELYRIVAVDMPIRMDCKYGWYAIVYKSDWDAMAVKTRNQLACKILCAIPFGDNVEGKINRPDFKDFGIMVRSLGVDYFDRPDSPDPLAEDVKWVH
jgi:hypothetical protein